MFWLSWSSATTHDIHAACTLDARLPFGVENHIDVPHLCCERRARYWKQISLGSPLMLVPRTDLADCWP